MWISKKKFDHLATESWKMGRERGVFEALDDTANGEGQPTFTDREQAMISEQRRILAIQHAVEMTPTPETLLPLAQTIEAYLRGDKPDTNAPEFDGQWLPDDYVATMIDSAVEGDERVQAWDKLVQHPFFQSCFDSSSDEPLLTRMLAKLDQHNSGAWSYSRGFEEGREVGASESRVRARVVDTEAVEEAKSLITAYEPRPVVAPGFPNIPEATDVCLHCGRPVHLRTNGRLVWAHDTGFVICGVGLGGNSGEPGNGTKATPRGPQGA